MDSNLLVSSCILLLLFVVLLLAWLFKDKFLSWDEHLRQTLFSYDKSQNQSGWGYLPSASYHVSKMSPEGHILYKREFTAVGSSLEEACNGVGVLLSMANEDEKREGEKLADKKA